MQTTYKHIVRLPNMVAGEPTIRDTRVPVRSIALTWDYTRDLDYICRAYPGVSREAAAEAVAYSEAQRDGVRRYIK